jgi:hypothetical protein
MNINNRITIIWGIVLFLVGVQYLFAEEPLNSRAKPPAKPGRIEKAML